MRASSNPSGQWCPMYIGEPIVIGRGLGTLCVPRLRKNCLERHFLQWHPFNHQHFTTSDLTSSPAKLNGNSLWSDSFNLMLLKDSFYSLDWSDTCTTIFALPNSQLMGLAQMLRECRHTTLNTQHYIHGSTGTDFLYDHWTEWTHRQSCSKHS